MTNKDLQQIQNRGKDIYIEEGFKVFNGHKNIFLGSNIYLVDALINAGDTLGKVTIEDHVFFGHGVKILARGHDYRLYDIPRQRSVIEKPIHIAKGVWIASGAIILGGVSIGENAVVAAGSIVTKDVPSNAIVAGNPAELIKYTHRDLTIFEKIKKYYNRIK